MEDKKEAAMVGEETRVAVTAGPMNTELVW